jgi:alpha-L-rhamnosidase
MHCKQYFDELIPSLICSLVQPEPGVYVLDFEQNFAGYVRLNLPAPFPGNVTITLRHAELLQHPPYGPQDGNIYVGNLRSALATEVYTTRQVDTGVLSLEPLFTYHGFRYVEIRGMPYPPVLDQVEGLYFRSGAPLAASLTFPAESANTLNQLQHAVQWGTGANLMSVQSDCPQRDERKGWMGDSGLSQEQTALNYDVCAFYTMWALNIQDSQVAKQYGHPDGAVPDTVPWTFGSDPGDPAWETAYPGVIWTMMRACGDLQLPANHYANLQAIIAFEASKANATGIGKMFSYYGE